MHISLGLQSLGGVYAEIDAPPLVSIPYMYITGSCTLYTPVIYSCAPASHHECAHDDMVCNIFTIYCSATFDYLILNILYIYI